MGIKKPITPSDDILDAIKQYLDYDPETGILKWKNCDGARAKRVRNGDIAGYNSGEGYIKVGITANGKKRILFAHHICWFLFYGKWSKHQIDHKNRVRGDNSAKNLRAATRDINRVNQSLSKRNKTGVRGVHYRKTINKYVATIGERYHSTHIGTFDTLAEARAARITAEKFIFNDVCPSHDIIRRGRPRKANAS